MQFKNNSRYFLWGFPYQGNPHKVVLLELHHLLRDDGLVEAPLGACGLLASELLAVRPAAPRQVHLLDDGEGAGAETEGALAHPLDGLDVVVHRPDLPRLAVGDVVGEAVAVAVGTAPPLEETVQRAIHLQRLDRLTDHLEPPLDGQLGVDVRDLDEPVVIEHCHLLSCETRTTRAAPRERAEQSGARW